MKKVASGVTTLYHYAGGNLIAETDENGVTLRDYIYLNGEPAALRIYGAQFGTMYYFVNDHLGTPQKIVNNSGQVVWAAAYLPFGKAQVKPETVTNNLRFPGQYYDAESGLHYNWHRYYDPDTGRYITADPIGLSGGINLYTYVGGNPVNLSDPKGLKLFEPAGRSACEYYKKRCDKECDEYACKAYNCCKAFSDDPIDSCIRGCLIAFMDRNCNQYGDLNCQQRKICVGQAHYDCYLRCNGAHAAASRWLLNTLPPQCQDAMNWVGGMGPQILY